jgi:hypothetical protein
VYEGSWFFLVGSLGIFAAAGVIAAVDRQIKLRRGLRATSELRTLLLQPVRFRRATAQDARLVGLLPHDTSEQLRAHGIELGDVILTYGECIAVLRVFVDEARTTVFYVIVVQKASVSAESYAGDEELKTTMSPPPPFVEPPYRRAQRLTPGTAPTALLAAHREFLRTSMSAPRRFESVEEVMSTWHDAHERMLAWRAAQPQDELLERDLRMLLGPAGYARFGTKWARKLRAPIPRATIHQPPDS